MEKELKVLCVCARGRNRSKYLAQYLRRKGYSTTHGGVQPFKDPLRPWRPVNQKQIDDAEVIIVMRDWILSLLREDYSLKNKKIIQLEITDVPRLIPEEFKEFRKLKKKEFNRKWTYPQLRKAIKPYLPLEEWVLDEVIHA